MDPSPSTLASILTESHGLTIAILIILLVLSAFFSATETAFSAASKIKLRSMEANGDKRARRVLAILDNYDRFITTVLIGNNIVNIALASIATMYFTTNVIGGKVDPTLLSTIVTTIVVLIFGEVTPKSLAKEHAESLCKSIQPVVKILMIVFFPLSWLLGLIKKLFKSKDDDAVTEDEIITVVEEAEEDGEIDAHESELIRSAIEFDDVDVYDVMIPRVQIVAIEDTESMEAIAEVFEEKGYSRLPVYHDTVDSIVGVIHIKDFYELYRSNKSDISPIIKSSVCVSCNMKISAVLRMMQKNKMHMAVVVDEFGGTNGLVTMEDIIEELVGEIYDEHDEVEELIRKVDECTIIAKGGENLAELFSLAGLNTDTGEEFESTTVGGWVTEQLKRIPVAGESFTYENLEVFVTKVSTKRVLEVRVVVGEATDDEDD